MFKIPRFGFLACSLLYSSSLFAHGEQAHSDPQNEPSEPLILAPGYEVLAFDAPTVGSYQLPSLGPAADGPVIDSSGEHTSLAKLMKDKVTVLSFIYRACDDVNGCPLATFVMQQLRSQLEKEPQLVEHVRLLSMSFDPENDQPEAMREYKAGFAESPVDWRFITASSVDTLTPILNDYGQPISRQALENEQSTISHMLRVFLIDQKGAIRNIYSATLLHSDTLLNDIKTVLHSATSEVQADALNVSEHKAGQQSTESMLTQPEDRSDYANGQYASQSVSLKRNGQPADLLALAQKGTLGLPPLPDLADLTAEKIALGRQLFYDRRLSINNTFSCAMCHIPQQAFTSNELNTSVGVEGRTVRRNAPSLFNVGYMSSLFHDGRETRLEHQVWSPLLAHNEMANPSIGAVLSKVTQSPSYRDGFKAAYGSEVPTMETLGNALASYQRSLVAANSRFDQWYYANQAQALSEQEQLGYELFTGKANCASCHTITDDYALFDDGQLHNTGIGYEQSMRKRSEPHAVNVAPGIVLKVDPSVYAAAAEKPPNDIGLYEITEDPQDRWKFRTPSIRNVALTAPYMHDGSLATLEEVIAFYNKGGIENPLLSPLIKPLNLSQQEQQALQAFLESLTGDSISILVNDGLAAPIGDTVE